MEGSGEHSPGPSPAPTEEDSLSASFVCITFATV